MSFLLIFFRETTVIGFCSPLKLTLTKLSNYYYFKGIFITANSGTNLSGNTAFVEVVENNLT
jgi:hypothetical protein